MMDKAEISDPVIFDVGAHKGSVAKRYRELFPFSKIYCFEPFPDSFNVLEAETASDRNITVVKAAVAKIAGKSTFYVNNLNDTSSLMSRPSSSRRYYPKDAGTIENISVDTITLDTFCEQNDLHKIDILKFDIQGGELNALKGSSKLLANIKVPLIYTEIMFIPHYESGVMMFELWDYLSKFGYSFFNMYGLSTASNGQLRQGDAIFISNEFRSEVVDKYPEELC